MKKCSHCKKRAPQLQEGICRACYEPRQEPPPGAKVLTKQQILTLLGDAGCEWAYANELVDELFGEEP